MRLSSSSSLFWDHIPTYPTPIDTIHFFPYTAIPHKHCHKHNNNNITNSDNSVQSKQRKGSWYLGYHYLSICAAHKSLESSLSLIVLASFFPSGGTGNSTSLPDFRASQNPHTQSPSGTTFNGGFKHFK